MAVHGNGGPDNFSLWHKCKRWTERGLTCPFGAIEDRDEVRQDEDADAKMSGAQALSRAVGSELGVTGLGASELIGPLLALFTVLRGIQTMKGGMQIGRVDVASLSERATVRTLRPEIPAKEGPRPSRPTKSPLPRTRQPAPTFRGAGGGFFVNQAAEMKRLIGLR